MWDEVEDQSVSCKREGELRSGFWKGMIGLGSQTCRHQGTYESAWEIIELFDLEGSPQRRTPLQIQEEMVDRKLPFHETAAAKTLLHFLVQVIGEFKKAWERIRNGARRTTGPKSPLGGFRRSAILSRSTIRSSESSWSVVSSTDTASISSRDSRHQSSPTSTVASGCSAGSRQDALVTTITLLGIALQVADIASIPFLRGIIGTVLHIAQLIQVSTLLLTAERRS